MEDTFYFALLRISVAQILKASGFDKCKPSVLNIVTELYIKHLELVVEKTKKFSLARSSATNDTEASDVVEALLSIGFIKPTVASDPQDKKNTKSLKSFKHWAQYSDSYSVSKKLSAVPISHLANLIEKRKIDTSLETDQERKKRRLRERQEYFNQLKQGDEASKSDKAGEFPEDVDEDELTAQDKLSWLAYLAEKDVKLGQNMKFVNTCIQDDLLHVHRLKKYHPTLPDSEESHILFENQIHNINKNDHVLLNLQEEDKEGDNAGPIVLPSSQLKSVLPYNVEYDECLVNDDLQQYLQYASTHEDEINERLDALERQKPDTENTDSSSAKDVLEEENDNSDQPSGNDNSDRKKSEPVSEPSTSSDSASAGKQDVAEHPDSDSKEPCVAEGTKESPEPIVHETSPAENEKVLPDKNTEPKNAELDDSKKDDSNSDESKRDDTKEVDLVQVGSVKDDTHKGEMEVSSPHATEDNRKEEPEDVEKTEEPEEAPGNEKSGKVSDNGVRLTKPRNDSNGHSEI